MNTFPYDLTSFLTTIASASASIVAILGGFIASKLLNLNSDRDLVIAKIRNIEEEQQFKQNELLRLKNMEKERLSFSFIRKHINDLLSRKRLDEVYQQNEQYDITLKDLRSYWEKAGSILDEIKASIHQDDYNSEGIPSTVAVKYKTDEFSYDICKCIFSELERKARIRSLNQQNRIFDANLQEVLYSNADAVAIADPIKKNADRNRIIELETELKWIKVQRKQLLLEKESLKKPKGMTQGLIIFALFSVFCIIVPLLLCPRYFENPLEFWTVKLIILALFILGLVAIFLYLVYLLRWNENE